MKNCILLLCFTGLSIACLSQNIVRLEYFIDTDPGFGNGTPFTISTTDAAILQNIVVVTAGLSVGYHKLYGRFKDDQGNWSQTFRRNIEIYNNDISNAVKAEYFFRTDQGFGNCARTTFIQPAANGVFSFSIQNSDIPAGADTLFIRVQDDNGRWSETQFKEPLSFVLPLTLLSFNVMKQNGVAMIGWQTSNELNADKFIIERGTDGLQFTAVGEAPARGNNTSTVTYNYTDNISAITQAIIYYRLKMVDKDGKYTYSTIRSIDNSSALNVHVYPNPVANSFLSVNLNNANGNVKIAIYTSTGLLVYVKQFKTAGGILQAKINTDNFSAGIYFIKVNADTGTRLVKFSKMR